jgi:phage gp37-like protein
MSYTVDEIYAPLLDLLKQSFGGIAETVDSYHGEVQDIVDQAPQLAVAFPAVFLLYGGATFEGRSALVENFTALVVYVAKDVRGGDHLRIAAHAMIEAGKAAISGNNLGLNIAHFRPGPVRHIRTVREFSIYTQQFTTWFTR